MKPVRFEYVRPASMDEALAVLGRHPEAVILAGGQSLLPMLNMRLVAPSHVVDISRLKGLDEISIAGGWLRLGALVRHCELAASSAVAEAAPLLKDAALHIGHPAIRNRGTIGGSLALADPAAELPACLLALGGRIEIQGPDGTRVLPAAEFFTGTFQTGLRAGEIIRAVEVPVLAPGYRSGFSELARRHGDYALAGLAAHARVDEGRVFDLRLAFFGASDKPVLALAAARKLEGEILSEANITAAAAALGDDIQAVGQPGCGAQTKLHHCGVLTRRALARLAA
ncbi:MAG: xanthine dehydrogenase family protein subunit M [Alphaproteobacteria bacterium]